MATTTEILYFTYNLEYVNMCVHVCVCVNVLVVNVCFCSFYHDFNHFFTFKISLMDPFHYIELLV